MTRAATWVASLSWWRRAIFAVLLGAMSVLAFAPFHLWPVLFLTFGPLVWLLDGCYRDHTSLAPRLKCASLVGFWFGFGYFLAGLYWVAEAFLVEPWRHGWLIPFVMTALPAGMALFFVAALALAMLMWRPGTGRAFALAIAFGLTEYARGHVLTGFPWNLVGYAPLGSGGMMQLASLFGVYALSLLAVLLFVSPAAIFAPAGSPDAGSRGTILLAGVLFIALGVGGLWGERRLATAASAGTGIRVRIVQADIDQAEKWRPENSAEIFTDYLDLTKSGASGLDGISIVVWPETAVPFLLAESSEARAAHRRGAAARHLAARGLGASRRGPRRARRCHRRAHLQQPAGDRRQGRGARRLRQDPSRPVRRISAVPGRARELGRHAADRRARRLLGREPARAFSPFPARRRSAR